MCDQGGIGRSNKKPTVHKREGLLSSRWGAAAGVLGVWLLQGSYVCVDAVRAGSGQLNLGAVGQLQFWGCRVWVLCEQRAARQRLAGCKGACVVVECACGGCVSMYKYAAGVVQHFSKLGEPGEPVAAAGRCIIQAQVCFC